MNPTNNDLSSAPSVKMLKNIFFLKLKLFNHFKVQNISSKLEQCLNLKFVNLEQFTNCVPTNKRQI